MTILTAGESDNPDTEGGKGAQPGQQIWIHGVPVVLRHFQTHCNLTPRTEQVEAFLGVCSDVLGIRLKGRTEFPVLR